MVEADGGSAARVGERLKAAREGQGASLEDVAARTRIPTRHLQSLEASDWSRLPATTYSVGFAKSYASAVGLDRNEIGEALRAEMSGYSTKPAASEVFEPADPARVMPRWLVIVAVIGVIAVVAGLLWARERELTGPDDPPAEASQAAATGPAPAAAPASSPSGPVVITANEPAWLQVYQQDGTSLFQGELAAGQSYQLPAGAAAPLLKTGKPEALRISVGTADAPSVGSGITVRDVSLLPADLMRGAAATPSAPPPAAAR